MQPENKNLNGKLKKKNYENGKNGIFEPNGAYDKWNMLVR